MVFGLSSDKSADSHVEEIAELKKRINLFELDIEKRITLIENTAEEMQKAVGAVEQLDSSKDAVLEIQEIKKTLREIEDTGLISKLETISNSDKITTTTDTLEALNEKIMLLSDAIEILSESKTPDSGDNSAGLKEISSIRSDVESLKNALSKMASTTDTEKLSELADRVASLEHTDNKPGADLKKTYDAYREKIDLLEQRISSASVPQGVPKDIISEISKIKEEVEKIKEINKKIVDTIEMTSAAHDNQKGLNMEGVADKNAGARIAELSLKVAEISKEMNLDRAIYPQDILNIKKEMNNLKTIQKNLVDTLESIVTKKGSINTAYAEDKIKNIEDAVKGISVKIPEIPAFEEKLKSLDAEIKSVRETISQRASIPASNDKTESRNLLLDAENKKYNALEKTVAELSNKISGLQDMKEKISAIDEKINSQNRDFTNIAQNTSSKETAKNERLSNMVKMIAEENKILRQEIEQLKQTCSEIIKENREQPIIID